jgi:hypothetical protein
VCRLGTHAVLLQEGVNSKPVFRLHTFNALVDMTIISPFHFTTAECGQWQSTHFGTKPENLQNRFVANSMDTTKRVIYHCSFIFFLKEFSSAARRVFLFANIIPSAWRKKKGTFRILRPSSTRSKAPLSWQGLSNCESLVSRKSSYSAI